MRKKTKNAFTMAEIITTLGILGALIAMSITLGKKLLPDYEKAGFKKAKLTVEQIVHTLINNEAIYPGEQGFKNTKTVESEFGELFGADGQKKFRDLFKYYVNPVEEDIDCKIFESNKKNDCFRTDDGVIYGIPDTDFENNGVITTTTSKKIGNTTYQIEEAYTPITIYPSSKVFTENSTNECDAIIIGVRFDGRTQIINRDICNTMCERKNRTQPLECRVQDFITTTTITQSKGLQNEE